MGISYDNEMVEQIENQLTDLFDDDDVADKRKQTDPGKSRSKGAARPSSSQTKKQEQQPDNPKLKKLKEVVLSLEWEISDDVMSRFLDELETLKTVYETDRPVFVSLQLLGSVGKIIQKDKIGAHPEAIPFLHDVYNSIESLTVEGGSSEEGRRKRVRANVAKFNALKEKISSRAKTAAQGAGAKIQAENGSKKDAVSEAPDRDAGVNDEAFEAILERMQEMKPQEAFAYMLVEIKKTIRAALKDRQ